MERTRIRVLLIEDNPGDRRLVQQILGEAPALFELKCADRLAEGLELLAAGRTDLVLLDLGLPDSQGLETVARVRASAPKVPVVVLSGTDDAALATEAVKAGAQDYLVKGRVDRRAILRSMRYAAERHQVAARVDTELSALQRLHDRLQDTGSGLQEAQGEVVAELVEEYRQAMDLLLEQPADEAGLNASTILRGLAERLGGLRASAADVLDLHATALRRKAEASPPEKWAAYGLEARLTVLELMGHLASFYRAKTSRGD